MEDSSHSLVRRGLSRWMLSLFLLGASLGGVRAQTTNIINLCTEEALRAFVELGGVYQMGDCGTNLTILTIPVTRPLVVERDFTLVATQQVLLNAQSLTRLFVVRPGVRLTLENILFFSGRHTETNFNDGGIADTAGAGIYNDGGIVTIRNGRFEANAIVGVTGFAAEDGTGDDGERGGDGAGGAIYNNGGQIWISNTVFAANSAAGGPGGKGGNGQGNPFGGSGGNGGSGGSGAGAAIYSRGGTVAIYSSTFSSNTVAGATAGGAGAATGLLGFSGAPGRAGDGVGGAVAGDGAEIVLYGCTFVANSAKGTNGLGGVAALRNLEGGAGLDGGAAAGGAVYSTGNLRATNCTFYANSVTSGSGGAGAAGGSSGFGGDGGDGGDGGGATGGAIESSGPAAIVNCTFTDNVLTAGTGGAAGAASGFGDPGEAGSSGFFSGSAIYGRSADVIVANSLLASAAPTLGGTVSDRGGNIATDRNALILNAASLRLTNPLLRGGLATNGGPTQTFALATNSPAIDAGVLEFCPGIDQRGSNRVGRCDSGAVELFGGQALPSIPTNVLNALAISGGTNLVTLSWPSGYTNLFLQFSTNLLSTNTVWAAAPQTATTNGSSNIVTIQTTNPSGPRSFFRLFGITNVTSTGGTDTNSGPPVPGL